MTPSEHKAPSLFDGSIIGPAVVGAFTKLDPRVLVRNPVMFVTAIGAVLTTIRDPKRLKIIRAILNLGRGLGIRTTDEGIGILDLIEKSYCNFA